MEPLLPLLLALALIIAVAKASGYLSNRLGQPAVLGELLAGILLGPTILDMLGWPVLAHPHLGETLSQLAHLGVLFLMFIAGLEVDLVTMADAGRAASLTGVLGVLVPMTLGAGVATAFGFPPQSALFIGLILGATSVSISAQTLMELGVLRTRVGQTLLSAAIVDDVLVLLLLAADTALLGSAAGSFWPVAVQLAKVVLYLALALALGRLLLPRLVIAIDALPISEGVMAFAIVVTLLYAWSAEALAGMAGITGAFIAGLLLATTPLRAHLEPRMHTLAYSWLVPVFFVSIGLQANARELGGAGLPFTLSLLAVALLSKLLGGGIGSRLGGLARLDAVRVGIGMASRGEVGLIVATVGLDLGVIGPDVFAGVLLLVLVSSIMTPVSLKAMYSPRVLAAFTSAGAEQEA